MANAQVGRPIRVQSPPKFDNCTVRGGTWEEDDATKIEMNEDADEETFNTTAYDRGSDIKTDVYPDADFEPEVNGVLTETSASATEAGLDEPRSWVITKIARKRYGKRGLIYSCNLIRRDAQDTTQITEAES